MERPKLVRFLLAASLCMGNHGASQRTVAQDLTPAMKAEMGSATWIPADAGFFACSYRLGEQVRAVTQSRAWLSLKRLAFVQMGLAQWQQSSARRQFDAACRRSPLLADALEIAKDASAQEVFLFLDRRGPSSLKALADLYGEVAWQGMLQGIRENRPDPSPSSPSSFPVARLIESALDSSDQLRVPGLVVGFRLSDRQRGAQFVADLAGAAQTAIPFPWSEQTLGGGRFFTLQLSAPMFLDDSQREEILDWLSENGVDPAQSERFVTFLESQEVVLSFGMRDDYLLFACGADTSHLAELGRSASLAASPALDPIRRNFRPRLVSLSYVHASLTGSGKIDVSRTLSALDAVLTEASESLPDDLAPRLRGDARDLLTEVNHSLPEATPTVAASFWNRGIESFAFSALPPHSIDDSEALGILAHVGSTPPLLARASRAAPSHNSYDRAAHWAKKAWGYFEDYAVPQIPEDELAAFQRFERLFLPTLEQIDAALREALMPASEGCQSLLVVDAGGVLQVASPKETAPPIPFRYPRPALACDMRDADLALTAITRVRLACNQFLDRLAAEDASVEPLQIPAAQTRPFADGTLAFHRMTIPLPPYLVLPELELHNLRVGNLLVWGIAPTQSSQIAKSSPGLETEVVDFAAPAASALWWDAAQCNDLLFDDIAATVELLLRQERASVEVITMVKMHLPTFRRALGVLRSYASRTYQEEGLLATHSWWHIEDAAP